MARKPFLKTSKSNTNSVFEIVNVGLCGLTQATTPSGKQYFMTTFDEYPEIFF